jgi:hypothetical protein
MAATPTAIHPSAIASVAKVCCLRFLLPLPIGRLASQRPSPISSLRPGEGAAHQRSPACASPATAFVSSWFSTCICLMTPLSSLMWFRASVRRSTSCSWLVARRSARERSSSNSRSAAVRAAPPRPARRGRPRRSDRRADQHGRAVLRAVPAGAHDPLGVVRAGLDLPALDRVLAAAAQHGGFPADHPRIGGARGRDVMLIFEPLHRAGDSAAGAVRCGPVAPGFGDGTVTPPPHPARFGPPPAAAPPVRPRDAGSVRGERGDPQPPSGQTVEKPGRQTDLLADLAPRAPSKTAATRICTRRGVRGVGPVGLEPTTDGL